MPHIPNGPAIPSLDRRSLLRGGALGLGLAASPLAAQGGRGFTHGVASGEPSARSVLLWTRYVGTGADRLRWEVAEAEDFAKVVSGGDVVAGPESDWCVKAVAGNLAPGRWYRYRFVAPDGTVSETGRTRTLPEGRTDRFRMAVFSCSNMGFGYFNAYAHAGAAGDFDLAVHLGDYLYEYDPGNYPSADEAVAGRVPAPANELIHLADYRARYASYRSDPDLRRLHAMVPMIAVFDDHETANDAWKGGAQNHQPETEGPWAARTRAAMQARSEWLPVSEAPWARYDVGDLATLLRIETRLTARDKPLDLSDMLKGLPPQAIDGALASLRDGAWADPARSMLGTEQEGWLAGTMAASVRSGRKWQVLVQQVVLGSLRTPPAIAQAAAAGAPDYVRARIASAVRAGAAGLPSNMDAWDGYPAARKRLLAAAQEAGANLVTLTGDTHNAWAFDLANDGAPVGVEFAGQSVSSPGFEAYFGVPRAQAAARALVAFNEGLAWMDATRRGYMAVELTPARASCEWRFSGSVKTRSAALAGTHRMVAEHGARRLTAS
ncbi:alkaline phosphatase D family protein [Tsuneonella amylolytica]|uniref:alkaline phosphatase D family protein n=1 Tax=Tsuneonella amylolytica TaxID=2338327 RepID=UPI000EA9E29B|nr:alkaline phosphatase D family protein [Tsuneonella amylolytica]